MFILGSVENFSRIPPENSKLSPFLLIIPNYSNFIPNSENLGGGR